MGVEASMGQFVTEYWKVNRSARTIGIVYRLHKSIDNGEHIYVHM